MRLAIVQSFACTGIVYDLSAATMIARCNASLEKRSGRCEDSRSPPGGASAPARAATRVVKYSICSR